MASPNRFKLSAAAAVAVLGGAAAIALTSGPDPTPNSAATPVKRPPVEVRTKVIRRTIHRVKRERPQPSAAPPASSAAAATPSTASTPVPVVRAAPVQPAATPPAPVEPVTTRTSGSAGGEDDDRFESEDHEGERNSYEAEHEDD